MGHQGEADAALLAVLEDLERSSRVAVVAFDDGEVYELRIVSTAHVAAGGDALADVVRNLSPEAVGGMPDGTCIDFSLADVGSVTLDGAIIYDAGRP